MIRRRLHFHCRKSAIVLAVLATGLLAVSCTPRASHKESRDTGYEGIARTQPFLAAERLLASLGWEVRRDHAIKDLGYGGTLILNGDGSSNQITSQRALEWAENQHGHLILLLSGSESWRNDWEPNFQQFLVNSEELNVHPVLKKLHLTVSSKGVFSMGSPATIDVEIDGESYEMKSAPPLTLHASSMPGKADVLVGTKDEASLVSMPLKSGGRITVVCDGVPFRNRQLDTADHAQILVALVSLGSEWQQRSVAFLLHSSISFYGLLWDQFWMPIIALAVLLLAWLWKNFPRFGPLLAANGNADRQFSDHLRMTGNFLWSRRRSSDLLQATRQAILRRLQVRHHGMSGAPEDRLMEHFSGLTQIPYDRVARAWQASESNDSGHFLAILRDLQSIHQAL